MPVAPGDTALAQLVLDRPLSAMHGDRIVLRDTSGRRTLGGARVVDAYAPRRVRDRKARMAMLEALIRYIRDHEDVWFATHEEVARYCLEPR